MFIPLHDDTPLKVIRFQYVTFTIIAINVAVFLLFGAFQGDAFRSTMAEGFGLVPQEFLKALSVPVHHRPVPELTTAFTSLFVHGGWMHLIGNMLFMWVFADNVEDAFGYLGFACFYLICGLLGGLAHVFMMPHSDQPLIGASSAVSGVLAAYVVLYPKARVWILLFMRIPLPLPALWVLGGWFLIQVFGVAAALPGEDVAFWAHIGGFGAGLVITLLLRRQIATSSRGRI
jgi:membrane associated rhomboid family serine protease